MIFAFESFSQIPKTYADFWQNIELTSSKAKLIQKEKRSSARKYITIGLAGVLTGAILYFSDVFQNDKIEAIDDVYKVACGEKYEFNPIENDIGNNLRIKSFTGNPSGLVYTDNNIFIVTPEITNSFSFSYTIEDEKGNTSGATVFIEITKQTLNLDVITLNTESGIPVSGNILSDIVCISCNLTNMSGPPEESYTWTKEGSFEVLIHNLSGIENLYKFVLTIEGECIQKTTVDLLINVKPKICVIDPEFKMIPANCDSDDGSISLISEVDPHYSFLWDNGSTSKDLINVRAGEYMLTMTNPSMSCTKEFSFFLEENSPKYFSEIEIHAGNCIESGEIRTQIEGSKDDQFLMEIVGIQGTFEYIIGIGEVDIASLISQSINGASVTGKFVIKIRNLIKNERCTQEIEIEIPKDTFMLSAVPDHYKASPNVLLKGNVLKNDIGTGLNAINIDQIEGASIKIESNGDFEFKGNKGNYQYTYQIRDTCGTNTQGSLKIEVNEFLCNYAVYFDITPSLCGAETGEIFAVIVPDDGATLLWSNGKFGDYVDELKEGIYSLTITHPTGSCFQEFTVIMPEQEINYIQNSEIVQSSCEIPAEIIFDLNSPVSEFILMVAEGPSGSYEALLPSGISNMSEYMNLIPGWWIFSFNATEFPEKCIQQFTCELFSYIFPELVFMDKKNPSTPDSNDGIVIVNIAGGNEPFSISIPGKIFIDLKAGINLLYGFSQGVYELTAIDKYGCPSNSVYVEMQATGAGNSVHYDNSILLNASLPLKIPHEYEPISLPELSDLFMNYAMLDFRMYYNNLYSGFAFGNSEKVIYTGNNILRMNSSVFSASFGQSFDIQNTIISYCFIQGYMWVTQKEFEDKMISLHSFNAFRSSLEYKSDSKFSIQASIDWFFKDKKTVFSLVAKYNFSDSNNQ
ncbi:MAG TPA: hypothetical protein DCQ58_09805 [Saprospirales bacterium]|nr:hypothetical protein [Saprospirales bacterium]